MLGKCEHEVDDLLWRPLTGAAGNKITEFYFLFKFHTTSSHFQTWSFTSYSLLYIFSYFFSVEKAHWDVLKVCFHLSIHANTESPKVKKKKVNNYTRVEVLSCTLHVFVATCGHTRWTQGSWVCGCLPFNTSCCVHVCAQVLEETKEKAQGEFTVSDGWVLYTMGSALHSEKRMTLWGYLMRG